MKSHQAAAAIAAFTIVLMAERSSGQDLDSTDFAGDGLASIDDFTRFEREGRPVPSEPVTPPLSTPDNVDTGRPFDRWQRATDDWAGWRPKLEDRGVSINATNTFDFGKVFTGGLDTERNGFQNLFDLNITIDTGRLFGFEGGTLFVDFQQADGVDHSAGAGDFQGLSNIGSDRRTQISELWYEQVFADGRLRVKAGKIDSYSDFAFVDYAGEFLNAAIGALATMPQPTYPDAAFGVVFGVQDENSWYVNLGAFDGAAQEGYRTGTLGPKTLFDEPADMMYMLEAGCRYELANLPGRAAVGGWNHTGTFDAFDATTDHGTGGFYMVVEQTLFLENPNAENQDTQGLHAFAQYGWADADVSEVEHHLNVGAAYQGLLTSRDEDVIGVGATCVWFSDQAGFDESYELSFDAFYKIQLTNFVSIKPFIQYVSDPAGSSTTDDVFAGGLRVAIDF